ncbi:SIMPL domain-containing protein [Winogradskyella rapida]|uniref:SIMPL domain-containing protein n=1 Tax=Winogradskyella rapida TaxID=549701 RepID=A0ABW3KNR6_9FLAO
MKKLGILFTLSLLALQSYGQQKNFIDQAYLETTAVVDTLVVPDQIYLDLLISEKDTKGRTSVEELENQMYTKLEALGIDTKTQLALSDVASNFKNYFLRSKEVLKNKAYTLEVYDAEMAGKVIVALEAIEIANVSIRKMEYSKIEALKINLKQKAILRAKAQAEALLKPLNQNLGKALYISDVNFSSMNYLQGKTSGIQIRGYASLDEVSNYQPIDIEFEKIKIESTVTVKFAIE